MHISEGVLPGWELAGGWIATAIGLSVGLEKLEGSRIPLSAFLSAVFFLASLVHIPAGPTSVHLLANGMIGLLLGWMSFPAIFVGLILQAIFLQFGGITTLGINTFNMAFPGVAVYYISAVLKKTGMWNGVIAGIVAGTVGVAGAGALTAVELATAGRIFTAVAKAILLLHIPVAVIESIVYVFVFKFLEKNLPDMIPERVRW